jgi:hypothetical protein
MAYFQTKNPNLGKFLEGLAMEDIRMFYAHLVYVVSILYILRLFGIFFSVLLCSANPIMYIVGKRAFCW